MKETSTLDLDIPVVLMPGQMMEVTVTVRRRDGTTRDIAKMLLVPEVDRRRVTKLEAGATIDDVDYR